MKRLFVAFSCRYKGDYHDSIATRFIDYERDLESESDIVNLEAYIKQLFGDVYFGSDITLVAWKEVGPLHEAKVMIAGNIKIEGDFTM